ncbi:hypothetical protein OJF2_04180 [Aquisphaera giovannonii]|uniref:Uncharacterized protein n=1 Tax=Aquisphaera giovannonii TaxID=406548 RepID=A0A5B9VVR5_9BACT|nr:hypothetical protein [Aquisphaera giovannonii]QEH31951.1 hypothetical protein OJF2_04180 [Aquisphaera giovannonii]
MEQAVEWFVFVTSMVVGLSHAVRADDWVEVYARLHRAGRPGAFANGALSLIIGAGVVSGHGGWSWPGAVLTAFGWLMILKGATCFLAPDRALRSMERAPSRARFVAGGIALLAMAAWAGYCLWRGAA